MLDLRKISTVDLIDVIADATVKQDQYTVNAVALELAKRIYVPNQTTTFEELLYKFGYRDENKKIRG